jgi:hypothetical protein
MLQCLIRVGDFCGVNALLVALGIIQAAAWTPAARGITCLLLKYRVPHSGPSFQRDCNCWINPKPAPQAEGGVTCCSVVFEA